MRLTALLLLIGCLGASAHGYSQKITLSARNAPLRIVLREIEKQSNYQFLFFDSDLKLAKKVTIRVKDAAISDVLEQCFNGQPLSYETVDNTVVIKVRKVLQKGEEEVPPPPPPADIHGHITDKGGRPMAGASITVRGSNRVFLTDDKGDFTLTGVEAGETIIISYVGFETQQVTLKGSSSIRVVLETLNARLSEVVVVSYGKQPRADITGSIATVKAQDMADEPVGQFAQKLQGQVAGVDANINSGKPGQGMEIQIRGAISINAGNYPLVVVDGQPLTPFQGQNPINNINPDEIESFTVLKDASATALYGSRAASGVILITTKQARSGRTHVEFDAYYGEASLDKSHVPQMMDAGQLANFMNGYYEQQIATAHYINPATGTATVPAIYANPSQYGKGTDWLNQVLRTAPTQNYSVSLSDAREKSSTSIVAGYFNQEGIVKNTGYTRYSFRANNEFRPVKGLRLGLNIAPSQQIDHNSQGGPTDGSRNIVEGALLSSPLAKPYNSNGTIADTGSSYGLLAEPNFEVVAQNQNNVYTTNRILGNTYIEWDVLKGLTFRTAFDVDLQDQANNVFVNEDAAAAFNAPPPRPISSVKGVYATDDYTSWVSENTLTYRATFLKDHHIEALAGYTAQKYSETTSSVTGTNYPDQSIPYISAAGTTSGTSGFTEWTLLSSIGRLNYNYKEKYLLSGAVRSDGSSKFGVNKQYGVFPSLSVGWVVTKEAFMKDLLPKVNFLKIRASDGLTGNNNFNSGNYPAISLISPINYVFGDALVGGKDVSQLGNSDLTWEKNRQVDIGVDAGLWNDRVQFTYDYYNKLTVGLLFQVNIPQSSGFSSVSSNIGTFKFWGHEFSVSSRNLTGAFKWNTNANITFNRNLIMKLGTQNLPILPVNEYSYPNIQMVGHPIGMFYGYVSQGVYMNQAQFDTLPKEAPGSAYLSAVGSVRMKDVNKDGVITSADRTFLGNPNPKFLFGFINNFSYKQFDLNIVLSGSVGGQIEDERAQSAANLDGAFNLYANQLNNWRSAANPGNGIVPSTQAATTELYRTVQSDWIHSGSYLACRNIALGYNIPVKGSKYFNRLRAYLSVQQAFVITKYPGFSPETNSQGSANINGLTMGVDNTEYPVPRTITLGLNMGLF